MGRDRGGTGDVLLGFIPAPIRQSPLAEGQITRSDIEQALLRLRVFGVEPEHLAVLLIGVVALGILEPILGESRFGAAQQADDAYFIQRTDRLGFADSRLLRFNLCLEFGLGLGFECRGFFFFLRSGDVLAESCWGFTPGGSRSCQTGLLPSAATRQQRIAPKCREQAYPGRNESELRTR
jgi:hypothetical protein